MVGREPPQGTSGMHKSSHLIMSSKNRYSLGMGISTVCKIIYHSLNGGGRAPPEGTSGMHHSSYLIMSNKKIYGLGVGILTIFKIIYHSLNGGAGTTPGDFWYA